jgi:hypothetical protein
LNSISFALAAAICPYREILGRSAGMNRCASIRFFSRLHIFRATREAARHTTRMQPKMRFASL